MDEDAQPDLSLVSPLYAPGLVIAWNFVTVSVLSDSIADAFVSEYAGKNTRHTSRHTATYNRLRSVVLVGPTVLISLSYPIIAAIHIFIQIRQQEDDPRPATVAAIAAPGLLCYNAACVLPMCWFGLFVIDKVAKDDPNTAEGEGYRRPRSLRAEVKWDLRIKFALIAMVGFLMFGVRCLICKDPSFSPITLDWRYKTFPRNGLNSHLICSTVPTPSELRVRGNVLSLLLIISVLSFTIVSMLGKLAASSPYNVTKEPKESQRPVVQGRFTQILEVSSKAASKFVAACVWGTCLMGFCEFMLPSVWFLLSEIWKESFLPATPRKVSDHDQMLSILLSGSYLVYSIASCFIEWGEMKRRRDKTLAKRPRKETSSKLSEAVR